MAWERGTLPGPHLHVELPSPVITKSIQKSEQTKIVDGINHVMQHTEFSFEYAHTVGQSFSF